MVNIVEVYISYLNIHSDTGGKEFLPERKMKWVRKKRRKWCGSLTALAASAADSTGGVGPRGLCGTITSITTATDGNSGDA